MTMGADWKVIGASGRQAGVEDRVADLRTTEPSCGERGSIRRGGRHPRGDTKEREGKLTKGSDVGAGTGQNRPKADLGPPKLRTPDRLKRCPKLTAGHQGAVQRGQRAKK